MRRGTGYAKLTFSGPKSNGRNIRDSIRKGEIVNRMHRWGTQVGLIAATAFGCLVAGPEKPACAQEVIWRGPVSAYYFGPTRRPAANAGAGRVYQNPNGEQYYSGYGPTYGPPAPAYSANYDRGYGGYGMNYSQGYNNNVYSNNIYGNNAYNGTIYPPNAGAIGPVYSPIPSGQLGYSRYFPRSISRFDDFNQAYYTYGAGAYGVQPR